DTSTKVRDAVFGNVGTMIVFRVGAADAEFLENEFEPELTIADMVGLPNANIYLKLMVNGMTSRPFSASTLPPFKVQESKHTAKEVIESSRKRYARSRAVVEDEIQNWAGASSMGTSSSRASASGKFPAVCSSCGKDTTVPFEPMPGRPVYCLDCLNKIKSGELQPVRGMPQGPTVDELPRLSEASGEGGPRRGSTDDLAGLGIEFEESGGYAPRSPRPAPASVTRSGSESARPSSPTPPPAGASARQVPVPHPPAAGLAPVKSTPSRVPMTAPVPATPSSQLVGRPFIARPLKPIIAKVTQLVRAAHSAAVGQQPKAQAPIPSRATVSEPAPVSGQRTQSSVPQPSPAGESSSAAPRRRLILEGAGFAASDVPPGEELGLSALAAKVDEDRAKEEHHRQKQFATEKEEPSIEDLRAALRASLQRFVE
ncbi:MAG: hypothetical protein Q7S84_02305, partial [bacterium]|nr:hypothetical protein [bacterium]